MSKIDQKLWLTNIKDIDRIIILQLDFNTIINLHSTKKSIKSLIEELLPEILSINNPNNNDDIIYNMSIDIIKVLDFDLLNCLLNIFRPKDDALYIQLTGLRDLLGTQHLINTTQHLINTFQCVNQKNTSFQNKSQKILPHKMRDIFTQVVIFILYTLYFN